MIQQAFDDGPRVLDCIEFDPAFRWGDVLYDTSFLAMDLKQPTTDPQMC